jgi:predicted MPP superfamily phosphohydrolase
MGKFRLKRILLVACAALAALALLFVVIRHETYTLDITRNRVDLGLGRPVRMVLLADLHLDGPLVEFDREVAREVASYRPEVVILAGDIVNSKKGFPGLTEFLELAECGAKILAIEGNWEEELMLPEEIAGLAAIIARKGGTFLIEEWFDFDAGGVKLRFGSLGGSYRFDKWRDLLKREPEGEPKRILVAHTPAVRDYLREGKFSLILAGHTHGGQIAPLAFFIKPFSLLGRYSAGWYGGNLPIYVTRGVGTSHIPVRIGSRPEISLFELY